MTLISTATGTSTTPANLQQNSSSNAYKWQPIQKKTSQQLTPLYLREALVIKSHQRFTRSSLGITFHPHNFKLVSVGAKSPYHNIGKVWNQLPVELRGITTSKTFKTRLKTHFFNLAYL